MSASPTGYAWHHNEKPGLLQLVHRADHAGEHSVYHPTGKGGRDIWGVAEKAEKGKSKQNNWSINGAIQQNYQNNRFNRFFKNTEKNPDLLCLWERIIGPSDAGNRLRA
ncbi:HNH endonuclease [Pseudomonas sp. TH03]|uniref:HNH endonuclease n=1 Tax=Pseudomonas sp. TH03 TaxID=2796369 RepID=UPI001F5BE52B|nr:HNH endonuclease [Pseudomonas sp. TH03]